MLLQNPADVPANLMNAGIVGIFVWPLFPVWVMVLWLGSVCAVSVMRALLRHNYAHSAGDAKTSPNWARMFTINAFIAGCLWGLSASVILMTPDPVYYNFIVFVLGGTMAGGVVCIAINFRAMLAFVLPTILPPIVALALRGSPVLIGMAIMLALFTIALVWTGRSINKSITENVRLRFGQQRLVANLLASEAGTALLAAIVDASDDAIVSETVAGEILSWNQGAAQMFGYRADEAINRNIRMLIPGDRAREIDGNLDALAHGHRIEPFDTQRRRKDGTLVPVSIAVSMTYDTAGTVVGASFIARDISERQLAANALAYRDLLVHAVTLGTETLLRAQSLDLGMPEALRLIGDSMGLDRIFLIRILSDPVPLMTMRYRWEAASLKTRLTGATFGVDALGVATAAGWIKLLTDGKPVAIQVATCEGPARALLENLGNKSTLLVPIFVGNLFWGAVVADACTTVREWHVSEIDTLRTFADIAGAIIRRTDADQKLQFANILLQTQMEASLDGTLVVDEKKSIVACNQRFAAMWQIPPADMVAGHDDAVLARVASNMKDREGFVARVDYLYAHPGEDSQDELQTIDGRFIDRHTVTLYTPLHDYLGRAWFFRDITDRKRIEALALRMARFDVLTGLANRAVFVEALQHAIEAAKRGAKSFAVIYLDLDHFKDVNDTLGHPVGDELLKAVADRLRANTRETDTVARFGGDEFAIIVADIRDLTDAAMLAEKLLAALADPYSVRGSEIHSGASIGIAAYGADSADAETLLSHADVALYRAKGERRGSYRFFTDLMDAEVRSRVTLSAELRMAVDQGQLFLMYQPQVAIATGRITGVEALVRWRHPTRGILPAALFIPLAEQIGIIGKLGHWVLWEACRQGKAWLDEGVPPVRIAVNVSALQFRAAVALEADIIAALAHTGLPPRLLELELTESMLMEASREHSDVLQRLRSAGVTMAIDDFGTGFSSLDYLGRFPSDRIKIAQTFVDNLENTPGEAAIVRATIGLARELKIAIIAEGVETRVQYDRLKDWGCAEVQGFLLAKPLTAQDAATVLRDGKISPPDSSRSQSKAPEPTAESTSASNAPRSMV